MADTRFLKLNDSFLFIQIIPYVKASFITCFYILNNDPVLNGGKKIYLYLLTNAKPPYTLSIKNGIAHTARQSNIQATLSSIKLHWGFPKIKAC